MLILYGFPLMGVIAGNSDLLFICQFSGSQYIQLASLIAKILSTRHLAEYHCLILHA
ncbi:hypothetical protein SALWKB12_1602 [Snodgrassella communis]|uniref:Uncharacterized protein n=1 Tax=Snodgrassella communis TaxID=2946699 RepID=A0A836MQ98_9NEIS|nr:hypothetical protein SALWKB12_1602 [Snodgrassella communis]KDN14549.1 hypothetical protein SALWKB29_1339 [Snodgrassella communis]